MTHNDPPTAERGVLRQWLNKLLAALAGKGQRDEAPPAPGAHPTHPKEELPMQSERDWTILLYMAGDNGRIFDTKYGSYSLMAEMTTAGHEDIAEVQQASTTAQVAVLAQFDTLGKETDVPKGAYRLEVHAGRGRTTWDDVVETIPEANTGDPAELTRFIVWGMARCPARHTMLVLWNHGTGWKDDPVYQSVKAEAAEARDVPPKEPRQENTAFFRSTAGALQAKSKEAPGVSRGILYDDTSMDFLTNQELSQALQAAQDAAGRRLSVIGMDACLMAMAEVQYQVRRFADVMVASQEVEPLKGWPYTPIVQALNAKPAMSPRELGALIVHEYERSYPGQAVTQSAVDLSKAEQTAQHVRAFSQAMIDAYPNDGLLQAAFRAAAGSLRGQFEDPDYVDLAEFVHRLLAGYYEQGGYDAAVLASGKQLRDWLRSPPSDGPLIACSPAGNYKDLPVSGASIYLPASYVPAGQGARVEPSPLYAEIDFAQAGWNALLRKVYETT